MQNMIEVFDAHILISCRLHALTGGSFHPRSGPLTHMQRLRAVFDRAFLHAAVFPGRHFFHHLARVTDGNIPRKPVAFNLGGIGVKLSGRLRCPSGQADKECECEELFHTSAALKREEFL